MKKMLQFFKNLKAKALAHLIKKDGEKDVPNGKNIIIALSVCLVAIGLPVYLLSGEDDTSFVGQTEKRLSAEDKDLAAVQSNQIAISQRVAQVIGNYKETGRSTRASNSSGGVRLNYRATQVIARDSTGDPEKTVPIGTNLIGKTLTAIDTREPNQTIKILLPYGGKSRNGAEIAKNTILFGNVNYSGKGEKIYVTLNKGLTPEGREFPIEAQALNPKDYSTGIEGESHSNSDIRILSAVGLSVVAGAADIYTQRETMSGSGMSIPRQSLRNALYQGASQQAQAEAGRKAENVNNEDYITLRAGTDVIVSLTKSFIEEDLEFSKNR